VDTSLNILLTSAVNLLQIYLVVLVLRVTLTWFPNINWFVQPFYAISLLSDPFIKLFRGLLPSLFGMDISPMLGFMFLQFLIQILDSLSIS
jgi:YggT family protein